MVQSAQRPSLPLFPFLPPLLSPLTARVFTPNPSSNSFCRLARPDLAASARDKEHRGHDLAGQSRIVVPGHAGYFRRGGDVPRSAALPLSRNASAAHGRFFGNFRCGVDIYWHEP